MKIVRIIARLNVGGPAKHVAWVTAGTRRAGHESVLIAGTVPPGEDDMGYFAAAQGVAPVHIAEMSREISPRDAITVWKLYRLFARERPDVVHTHTAKAGTVGRVAGLLYRWATPAALVGRPRRVGFVHTYHGHIFHGYYGRAKTRLFLFIERLLARAATDRIVVISPQQRREIHEEFRVGRAEQFAVVPLGLDLTAFDEWAARRAPLRAELRAGEDELLVGIVGRLTEIKNHELFLEAAALCKARLAEAGNTADAGRNRRVRFVVVGDGHLRDRLEARARALGLADDVVFTGTRDDPENFYPALDVVALTSRNEGTPLTLIEAMANARAVCATAVGGVVDLVGAAENESDESVVASAPFTVCARGVRVRPGDAEAFAAALARLVNDEGLRRRLGARGREYVVQNYSVERLLGDLLKLYEGLRAPQSTAVADGAERVARRPLSARAKGE